MAPRPWIFCLSLDLTRFDLYCLLFTTSFPHAHKHGFIRRYCSLYLTYSITHLQICQGVFEDQLEEIIDIRGVHDFDHFLREYRPASADKNGHIRKQYAFTFEVREGDPRVHVRAKAHCAAETPWGPWSVILPFADTDVQVHAPEVCPPMAPPKPWRELQSDTAPRLRKFYNREFLHPVQIPARDLQEMRTSHCMC